MFIVGAIINPFLRVRSLSCIGGVLNWNIEANDPSFFVVFDYTSNSTFPRVTEAWGIDIEFKSSLAWWEPFNVYDAG